MASKDNVLPVHQIIRLNLDPNSRDYDGVIIIDLVVDEPTDRLVLDSVGHQLAGVRVVQGDETVFAEAVETDAAAQTITVVLPQTVSGTARLIFKFTGQVREGMVGLYSCEYKEVATGETKRLLCTQFETTYARMCFPCFDAPRFKHTFRFNVTAPADMVVLNGPDVARSKVMANGRQLVSFDPYPPSPSYTTALIVGDLDYIEQYTNDGVRVRVWTTRGQVEEGRFALDVAVKAVEMLSEWHDFPYKNMLSKIDHVALPKFAFGAMENLGLVTYREAGLLVKQGRTPLIRLMYVAAVIVHETNHMWDGNWVTPKTWADTWLNESFTTLLQFLITDRLFPEWNLWDKFTQDQVSPALRLAALKSTHSVAIDREVSDQESSTIFDAVSYNQGAAIARMMMGALGEAGLQQALRLYVRRFGTRCANADDMYAVFDEVDPTGNASATMRNWTQQAGYPVIQASAFAGGPDLVLPECAHGRELVMLKQRRFLKDRAAYEASDNTQLWHVPLPIANSDGSSGPVILNDQQLVLVMPDTVDALLLNAARAVPARMAYDDWCWQRLMTSLDCLAVTDVERAMLIDDAYAVTFIGLQSVYDCLDLIVATAQDPRFDHALQTWKTIVGVLAGLRGLAGDDRAAYLAINQLLNRLIDRPLGILGLTAKEEEPVDDALLRTALFLAGVDAGHARLLRHCLSLWNSGEPINPDLQTAVFSAVAMMTGIEPLLAKYRETTAEDLLLRLIVGMTNAASRKDLAALVDFAFTKEVRLMHLSTAIIGMAANPDGLALAWDTVKARWSELRERHGEDNMSLVRYMHVMSYMTEAGQVAEAQAFLEQNKPTGTDRSLAEIIESTRANLAWTDLNLESLRSWLKGQKSS